ncbi:nucleotidyltransferase family protein [Echinicola sp. CAU 1574]|uniref:Nucleotidyltransferase family protein n=1 Tax=Echinicola arenosa TaxID=2774144 RepID=A0ABR9ALV8_9BACT|nr:nucleotidyltransferase family protein [Echinicola arenosa]MBD8489347.1 nucleotidyltransferase family protein [Echinicola arenosa]
MGQKTFSIIILAAGLSKRLGEAKQLLQLNGQSLIQKAANIAISVSPKDVVIVLGHYADQVEKELEGLNVSTAINIHYKQGMGSSIKYGLQSALGLCNNLDGVLIMVCDQPFLSSKHLFDLLSKWQNSDTSIVASQYNAGLGVPAIFDQKLFPELLELKGDKGGKKVILNHITNTVSVSFEDGKTDIDTLEEYQKIKETYKKSP